MPFSLNYLNQLTHRQIDAAIEYLRMKLNYPLKTPLAVKESPYLRLFELIDPGCHSESQLSFNLKVLAKLSGGNNNELGWLTKHSRLVAATRIFLNFKIYGDGYLSDYGNNNTCLHDAVLSCAWWTKELTRLLIQNGANPAKKNDAGFTAANLYMNRILPEESKEFTWAYSSPQTTLKRKLFQFVVWNMKYYPESALIALKGLDLYLPLDQHPDLINFRTMVADDRTLLHEAVARNFVEVVQWLLEFGANPKLLMEGKIKPIHLAVANLKDTTPTKNSLHIIALLTAYELIWSIPKNTPVMPEQIVDPLLELNITSRLHRYQIARLIYKMDCLKPLPFSVKKLISTVYSQSNILDRKYIEIDFDSKIGEGAFGSVYIGLAMTNNHRSQEVAVKLTKRKKNQLKIIEEATLLSQLKHPNIVRFVCILKKEHFGYVMHYVAGGNLENFLERNSEPLSAQCLYSIGKQMNAGLRYLHDKGYVHLDFKPANLLLDNAHNSDAPRVLLADFGAAARVGQTRTIAVTTFAFCSPEGFDFKCPYAITHDTYSFGLCLGYMDTKIHPWMELGNDIDKHSDKIVERVSRGERTIFKDKPLSIKVATLVKWCWEQKPSERPSHDDIDHYLDLKLNPNAQRI